jgi:hypothetical protein
MELQKEKHSGQAAQTHAQNLISRVESKVHTSVSKYNDAHNVMVDLGALLHIQPTWQSVLWRLEKGDIQHLSEVNDNATEGRRQPLWIWVTQGVTGEKDSDNVRLQEGT